LVRSRPHATTPVVCGRFMVSTNWVRSAAPRKTVATASAAE